MRTENVACYRQSQDYTAGLAVARRFAAMEWLEDTFQFARWDAWAVVLELDRQDPVDRREQSNRALPP